MKKKYLYGIIFLILTFSKANGQNSGLDDTYFIVNFERSFNKGQHNSEQFYWMIPATLNLDNLSPVYFEGYSKTLLENCLNSQVVYPFDSFQNENYNFNDNYIEMRNILFKAVNENKKEILKIRKKYTIGALKENITVYLTVVKGDFCYCDIDKKSQQRINHKQGIYIPLKDIIILENYNFEKIDIYKLQNKMKLNNVSNIPW